MDNILQIVKAHLPQTGTELSIYTFLSSDAHSVFGGIDSQKLQSSMTLFDIVAPDNLFAAVLVKFFDGRRDRRTIDLIKNID